MMASGASQVRATSPGIVIHIPVEVGSRVAADDDLVIIECMKMELPIPAPRAGVVLEITVKAGDRIQEGDLLIVLDGQP